VCSTCFVLMCVEINDRKSLEELTVEELKRFAQVKGVLISALSEKIGIIDKIFFAFDSFAVNSSSTSYSMKKEDLPKITEPESAKRDESKNQLKNLEDLSVSSLKLILENNGVDFSDCLEKVELVHKIGKFCPQILSVNTKSELFNIPEQEQCIICYERRIDTVLLECGHLAVCTICSKSLNECPMCRRLVSRVVHTFHVMK